MQNLINSIGNFGLAKLLQMFYVDTSALQMRIRAHIFLYLALFCARLQRGRFYLWLARPENSPDCY